MKMTILGLLTLLVLSGCVNTTGATLKLSKKGEAAKVETGWKGRFGKAEVTVSGTYAKDDGTPEEYGASIVLGFPTN